MTDTTSTAKAQQLHALGRSTSYELTQKLRAADRAVDRAKDKMHDARVAYAKAAEDYRDARRAARALFSEEQLTKAGFPPMADPKAGPPRGKPRAAAEGPRA